MEIKRGDIYWVEIRSSVGSEMDKDRPGIIVTCNELNDTSTVVSVVYLSASNRHELPEHVTIRSAEKPSTALCEQIYTVSKERLGRLCGQCTPEEMERIDTALMIGLGLSPAPAALQGPQNGEREADGETAAPDGSVLLRAADAMRMETELGMYKRLYEGLLDRLTRRVAV